MGSDHHLPTGQHGQDVPYHVVFSKKMEHTKEVFKRDNVFQLFKNSVQMVFMNQNIKQMMLKLRQENVTTLNVTLLIGDNGKNGANVARTKRKIQKTVQKKIGKNGNVVVKKQSVQEEMEILCVHGTHHLPNLDQSKRIMVHNPVRDR